MPDIPRRDTRHVFELSEQAAEIVVAKAIQLHMSPQEALELMIEDFSPSTKEDYDHQRTMKREARELFFGHNPDSTRERAWNDGYMAGWEQFQARKLKSPFNKYLKDGHFVTRSEERWPNA